MKWEIKAQAEQGSADIYINDFIGDWIDDYWGFGVTSKQFIRELQDLPESVKNIRIHVNSPGGDVVSANHIANTIRDQRTAKGRNFEILIEGAAWSAATIITSAGQPTKIADNALMMIHDPWTVALGNASELGETADVMDKFRDSIVAAYRWKSPLDEKKLASMMAAVTWMDADEAVENGFADEKIEGLKAAACFDDGQLGKLPKRLRDVSAIPEKYRGRVQAMLTPPEAPPTPTPEPAATADPEKIRAEAARQAAENAREILDLCAKAGVPEAAAEWLNQGKTADQVRAMLKDAPGIRDACAAAKVSDRAERYIKAGMSLKEVRAELFDVLKARDPHEIDNHLGPEGERKGATKPTISAREIYAARAKR